MAGGLQDLLAFAFYYLYLEHTCPLINGLRKIQMCLIKLLWLLPSFFEYIQLQ